jgi:hypothetical protein
MKANGRSPPEARAMSTLGALRQAWTAADAALPLGLTRRRHFRLEDTWIGLAEGPSRTTKAGQAYSAWRRI